MRLLHHLSLGVRQVFLRLRATLYSSQKQWTGRLHQILTTHPPFLALLKELARGAVWVERREVREGLRSQLWLEETEVSVIVKGTGGALACLAGSLIIIRVVGMVGFQLGPLWRIPQLQFWEGRGVLFHVVSS